VLFARIPKRAARRADPERALRDAAVEEDNTDPVARCPPMTRTRSHGETLARGERRVVEGVPCSPFVCPVLSVRAQPAFAARVVAAGPRWRS